MESPVPVEPIVPVTTATIPMATLELKKSEVPPELQQLYNELYAKIDGLIGGQPVIDIRKDPTLIRLIIQSAMVIVEGFRNQDGKGWSGAEKRMYALGLVKMVINDLGVKGKIDPVVAQEIVANVDFFGGIAMDIAIAAAKKAYDFGVVFTGDVQKQGCKAACQKDCCCIIC